MFPWLQKRDGELIETSFGPPRFADRKFNQTLPRWSDQNPFQHNINQVFYSYTHQGRKASSETVRERGDFFQRLLL